ncbi:MAG TPA: SRPBCC family protein [Candidatus Limnocylindrales bacterium]|nr:SRPBCC family protein [Candidatus Limnocylindrales bacterium]
MIRVETSATIDRPVEDVARYVADIERMTEWSDMTASRRLTDGPTRDGTRAYAEVAIGPLKLGWTWQVTDFDPARGFAFKTISNSPFSMDGRVTLTRQDADTTRLDYLVDVRTRGLMRLLEPFIKGEVARNEAREATRIKERLEGKLEVSPAPAAAARG